MSEREQFEAWSKKEGLSSSTFKSLAWRAWQARAALSAAPATPISEGHARSLWALARMTRAVDWNKELQKSLAAPAHQPVQQLSDDDIKAIARNCKLWYIGSDYVVGAEAAIERGIRMALAQQSHEEGK